MSGGVMTNQVRLTQWVGETVQTEGGMSDPGDEKTQKRGLACA